MAYEMKRLALKTQTEMRAESRQVVVTVSTDQVDRSGDIVVQDGIYLENFKKTRTILWNHDQSIPIAQCLSIESTSNGLIAVAEFPPEGTSAKADEIYGLIKAGVINAASIGFLPIEGEPVDGKNPKNGVKIISSELFEFSFVSVPANPGAGVLERSMPAVKTKTAMKFKTKGLYAVGQLANLLAELGWLEDCAEWEAEIEGDGSPVPAMLHEALSQLGNALIAMTIEEVSEMLGEEQGEATKAIKTKLTKAFGGVMGSLGIKEKAGAAISKANQATLESACKAILEGHDAIKALVAAGEDDTSEEDTQKSAVQVSRKRQAEALSLVHN